MTTLGLALAPPKPKYVSQSFNSLRKQIGFGDMPPAINVSVPGQEAPAEQKQHSVFSAHHLGVKENVQQPSFNRGKRSKFLPAGNQTGSVFARSYNNLDEVEEFKPPVYPKTPEATETLMGMLRKSFLTTNMNPDQLKVIADAMFLKVFKQNEVIIRYGDVGEDYYVLGEGRVQVLVYKTCTKASDPDLESKIERKKELPAGIGFGEIALMYNDRRTASIIALEDCKVWTLSGRVFKNIIIN